MLPEPPPAGRPGDRLPRFLQLTGTLGKGPEARRVLKAAVGDAFAEMRGADLCCGYGGTFNIRDYATSSR
jgi:Fe-S oxidoreductase